MPEPVVHYRSRTSETDTATMPDRSGDLSLGTCCPRVADEDMDLVIQGLFPARGLRIESRFAFLSLPGLHGRALTHFVVFVCRANGRSSATRDQASERGGEERMTIEDGQVRQGQGQSRDLGCRSAKPGNEASDCTSYQGHGASDGSSSPGCVASGFPTV
ncbi:hypothetical protein TIFTF001_030313 [Ficus carica]|uniref:Uncharacterized protein n=1 Tax=Ficus carica TaxID=3494 RepID=A0AA88DTK8_FICCA|nr:hypothetical protein TIFTF001_030313 [Ficus carica]